MRVLHKIFFIMIGVVISTSSFASFHLIKVVEIFPGSVAHPNAQYVQLQMFSGGQNQVAGHEVTLYDSTGTLTQTFSFSSGVAFGANQTKILIATAAAVTLFGLSSDLSMTATIPLSGGKACFDAIPIDCVAWGSFNGPSNETVGLVNPPVNSPVTPLIAPGGLILGKALKRRLDIAGLNTVLDGSDDTNSSANDFVFGLPAPRNNAGTNGTNPASTCPNGVIEFLEQCDDNNSDNGDGCSSICELEPAPPDPLFLNGFE